MSMDFFEQIMKEKQPIYALSDFLKVKAPDYIEKDAMYYNEKGEGFLDTFYKTNPEPIKHEEKGKLFYTNEKGEIFNVVRKEAYILTNQTRKAESEKDFQEIYNREFEAKGLEDTPEDHNLFKNELFNQVESLISLQTENTNFKERDLQTISRANLFLSFLKHPITESNKDPGESTEHPQHNPNLWNSTCYQLFKYLHSEYCEKGEKRGKKTRYMNVWFYLNEYDPENYHLKANKEAYMGFVKVNYGITIKNKDKSSGYETGVYRTIDEHRQNFVETFQRNLKKSLL